MTKPEIFLPRIIKKQSKMKKVFVALSIWGLVLSSSGCETTVSEKKQVCQLTEDELRKFLSESPRPQVHNSTVHVQYPPIPLAQGEYVVNGIINLNDGTGNKFDFSCVCKKYSKKSGNGFEWIVYSIMINGEKIR